MLGNWHEPTKVHLREASNQVPLASSKAGDSDDM